MKVLEALGLSRVLLYLLTKMISRERVGKKKYKTTVDRTDLSYEDWSIHHEEELMDAIMYNASQRREHMARKKADAAFFKRLNYLLSRKWKEAHDLEEQITEALKKRESDYTLYSMQDL